MLPVGLNPSSLARIVTFGFGHMRAMRTMGVPPMRPRMELEGVAKGRGRVDGLGMIEDRWLPASRNRAYQSAYTTAAYSSSRSSMRSKTSAMVSSSGSRVMRKWLR